MRRARWTTTAVVLAAFALAAPAAAHDGAFQEAWWMGGDHPGWYQPSPESQSQNLKMIGSVSRTKALPTYRNSDLAFWGDRAYAGHYDGFQIVDISDPEDPAPIVDFDCPGSQHDVSVWRDLLFVSVETPRSSARCDSTTTGGMPGFEGMRIFNVADPARPELITGVPTDCGSHTHTLVPDVANGRVLLYVASYTASELSESAYGNECRRKNADGSYAHKKISVVEVPLRNAAAAKVVSEPTFPQEDAYRGIDGFNGCHDITVFTGIRRAASACMGEAQIWDISNKEQPKAIARVHNPNVEFFHSAAFSWDGRTVVFGDEAGGGTQARCRPQDPDTLGALWFYDVASLDTMGTAAEAPLSSWKVPRDQVKVTPEQALEPNCTMHNFNTLPMTKRNVLVSSAYAAGTTVVDFTDPRKPTEIGHHDPHGANTWSSYWYNGHIYTNDGGRGVDVMLLADKARSGAQNLPWSNPQTQDAVLR